MAQSQRLCAAGSFVSNAATGYAGAKNVPDFLRNGYNSSTIRWIYNEKLHRNQKQTLVVGPLIREGYEK